MTLKSKAAYVKATSLSIHSAPTGRPLLILKGHLSERPINVPD
jgi:hypothetical protein